MKKVYCVEVNERFEQVGYGVGYQCPTNPKIVQALYWDGQVDGFGGPRILRIMTFVGDGVGKTYDEAYKNACESMEQWIAENEEEEE